MSSIKRYARQAGFSLIEVLACLMILSLMGLSILNAQVTTFKSRKKAHNDSLAIVLAQERLERFAAVNPLSLSETGPDGETEEITRDGVEFLVTSYITVNSDDSRRVTIVVTPLESTTGGDASTSSTFSPWGV